MVIVNSKIVLNWALQCMKYLEGGPESALLIMGSSMLRKFGYIHQTHKRPLYRLQNVATPLRRLEYTAFPVWN